MEVYLANGDDGSLVFQVSDSGPGIADADLDHIFEHGWSTKDATAGGRGYGLALVRQVVESLGGDIEVSGRHRHERRGGLHGDAPPTAAVDRPRAPAPSAPAARLGEAPVSRP